MTTQKPAAPKLACAQCGGQLFVDGGPVAHVLGATLNGRNQVVGGELEEVHRLYRCVQCGAIYESESEAP